MKLGDLQPTDEMFYRQDTRIVAQQLLGMTLVHETEQGALTGTIVETEAYLWNDAASHSYSGKRNRNETMFGLPGRAYVYLSYGIHEMLNVVTAPEGVGEAVLIRAVMPIEGVEIMRRNRGQPNVAAHLLSSGPGRLTQAFALNRADHNGLALCSPSSNLRIETGVWIQPDNIVAGPRVGITKAVDEPWRYSILGNRAVSRP